MINFFSKYKILFYILNFFLVFLYLFPGSILGWLMYKNLKLQPQITPDFVVSANHLYAFFVFSIVGYLTYIKSSQYIFMSLYLIFLSIILEILHYFIPARSFEISDLFGNAALSEDNPEEYLGTIGLRYGIRIVMKMPDESMGGVVFSSDTLSEQDRVLSDNEKAYFCNYSNQDFANANYFSLPICGYELELKDVMIKEYPKIKAFLKL